MNADLPLAIGAGLAVFAVLAGRAAGKLGVPSLLVFVAIGMLAGEEGPGGIAFEDYPAAALVGSAAIAVILFAGGFSSRVADLRRVAAPAAMLATVGVLITAGVTALGAKLLTPLPWVACLLLGAVVASTDAAAVFAVLRGRGLPSRVRTLLEAESGANDPVAAVLVAVLTDAARHSAPDAGALALLVLKSFALGLLGGFAAGRVAAGVVNRLRLDSAGLYPVFVLAAGVLTFAGTNLAGGNGFLAVYLAGILLGRPPLAHHSAISRFLDGAASLMQIAVFVLLGLLSFPSRLWQGAPAGLGVAAVLVFVARPAAVWLGLGALARFSPAARFTTRETIMIAWAGLRGAVPIVFAMTPLLQGVAGADRLFDVVFFTVLVSAVVQGATVGPLAKRLGLTTPFAPRAPANLEIDSDRPVAAAFLDFAIDEGTPLAGRSVAELGLPDSVVIAAIWREGRVIPARGRTVLTPGDHVFVLADPGAETAVAAAFPARHVIADD